MRRFAESARLYGGDSFEVNEMLATKMLGEAHDVKPLDILDLRYRYYDYEFERYWQFYRLWGRLTYNPATAPDVWEREFTARFGPNAGPELMHALQIASRVLPRIVAASYRYQYFPTTRGWAEMNHQDDLAKFSAEAGSDIQQFENPKDEASRLLSGGDTAMRRPQTAEMTLDPTTAMYKGTIPAAFIEPKWDLMYFVEVVDRAGAGRLYPDLERETPYVIIPVKR